MQRDWDLDTHVPAIMISIASVSTGISFLIFPMQDGLITESRVDLKQLLFYLDRVIKGFMDCFLVGNQYRGCPLGFFNFETVGISQVLHSSHCLLNLGSHNIITVVESVITSVVESASLHTSELFLCNGDTVVECLTHDTSTIPLQILFS